MTIPPTPNDAHQTSDVLQGMVNLHARDMITLGEIRDALHERGFCILIIIFALPVAIPIPYPPGFTALPAIPLVLFSAQMMLGFDSPWLPTFVANKAMKRTTLALIVTKTSPYLRKLEAISRPRLVFFTSHKAERVVALLALICAICVLLPIPLGNALPSAGIFIMMLGLLTRDGLAVILGAIVSIAGLSLAVAVVYFGVSLVKKILFSVVS